MVERKTKDKTKDKSREVELEENWKRALADYRNLEKRVAEEKESVVKLANMILVSRLLPVLDNLEMLEKHVKDEGLRLTVEEFKRILKDEGVEEIEAEGKEFDPNIMEAAYEDSPVKQLIVRRVIHKGYRLQGKLIRPARVQF